MRLQLLFKLARLSHVCATVSVDSGYRTCPHVLSPFRTTAYLFGCACLLHPTIVALAFTILLIVLLMQIEHVFHVTKCDLMAHHRFNSMRPFSSVCHTPHSSAPLPRYPSTRNNPKFTPAATVSYLHLSVVAFAIDSNRPTVPSVSPMWQDMESFIYPFALSCHIELCRSQSINSPE